MYEFTFEDRWTKRRERFVLSNREDVTISADENCVCTLILPAKNGFFSYPKVEFIDISDRMYHLISLWLKGSERVESMGYLGTGQVRPIY